MHHLNNYKLFVRKVLLSCLLIGITLPLFAVDERMMLEEHEAAERELAFRFAPIKSHSDLQTYLDVNARHQTPFGKLSQGAQQRFLKSLVFTDKGLASFDYRDLNRELLRSALIA